MSGLSDHDPPPEGGTRRPPLLLVLAVVLIALVALHLGGVVGPGAH
jgi:hypothetical protein